MTNERHEKALEAADDARARLFVTMTSNAGGSERLMDVVRIRKECMEEGIRAYLRAMDAVICEAKPKAFLVSDFADGAYLTRSLKAAEKSDHHFDALHPALPNHFTNGE